jgi:hypothetical protein
MFFNMRTIGTLGKKENFKNFGPPRWLKKLNEIYLDSHRIR